MKPVIASLALAGLFATPALAEVTVRDAFVRSTGAVAAAYFVLENHGAADRLLSVTTPMAAMAELHASTENADGVMQMLPLTDGVEIPAHGSFEFAQGGSHVMLMGLQQGLKAGDIVTLTLTFAGQGPIEVQAPVRSGLVEKGAGHAGHGAAPAASE